MCEVAALKVGDIDSSRMVIRVDTARAARTATSCCRPNSCASFGPTGDWLSRLPGCFLVVTGIGRSARRRAFVWDIHCEEVVYDFMELCGKKTAAAVG